MHYVFVLQDFFKRGSTFSLNLSMGRHVQERNNLVGNSCHFVKISSPFLLRPSESKISLHVFLLPGYLMMRDGILRGSQNFSSISDFYEEAWACPYRSLSSQALSYRNRMPTGSLFKED